MPRTGANTRPPMTEAERAQAVVLYLTGLPLIEVAELISRSYGAVRGAVMRAGVMRAKAELPAGAHERILELWGEHGNVTKIVEVTGHCRLTVINSLARNGVVVPPQRPDAVRDDERARIVELYVGGKKIEDVAAEVGRGTATVHRALVKAGVTRRHGGSRTRRDANRVTADTTEREVEPMARRDNDAELEKAWDRRAQDEEAMKRKLPPPQNRAEQQAMRGVRDPGQEDDN